MNTRLIARRSLRHYWRTNLAVVAGVAVAVAVLAGALMVGDSVTASLQRLALERLGATSHVITAEHFFRAQLANDLFANPKFEDNFRAAVPLIALEGVVTHEKSKRRAASVQVYGVDARFWEFHSVTGVDAPASREALLSESLAAEFGSAPGDAILLRIQNPSEIPLDTLNARKDELGRTLRLTLLSPLDANEMGEFSLRPQQGAVRAVFVPLARLQEELKQQGKANMLLVSESKPADASALSAVLRDAYSLADVGVRVEAAKAPSGVVVESDQILIPDGVAEAVAGVLSENANAMNYKVFAYLATSIRIGEREIPYSLVTAIGQSAQSPPNVFPLPAEFLPPAGDAPPPLLLSDWAMRDLGAKPGDTVTLDYLVWEEGGRLVTRSAEFSLRGGFRTDDLARVERLLPQFPGISESPNLSDWNPPFPVDLKRLRPKDEDYWHKYRTTPKAIIPLEVGQKLWGSRYGKLTSLGMTCVDCPQSRYAELAGKIRAQLDPTRAGFTVAAVRQENLSASQGAVDFGEYFVYFSFFLVVSALLLAALFFRLGIEQRLKEIGLLRAMGFTPRGIRKLFLREGLALAGVGSLLGLIAAVGYAALMVYGLRTWWVDAVGTTLLTLRVRPQTIEAGIAGGILAAMLAIALTLRALRHSSPRSLLHGEAVDATLETNSRGAGKFSLLAGLAATLGAAAMLAASLAKLVNVVAGFFGAGALLLIALVVFAWRWLASQRGAENALPNLRALGFRNATWRPGRSLLCVTLVASATFILVAVESFRRTGASDAQNPQSGTGGYALVADSLVPIPYDPNTPENLRSMNLGEEEITALAGVKFFPLRLRPGDDASCLNLYSPRNPKILGVPHALIAAGHFSFSDSLAASPQEKENPWRLLESDAKEGAIPAMADANSLTYVLKLKVGDIFTLPQATDPATGHPVKLRLVGALRDSIFKSELLIAEKHFLRAFPYAAGYRAFLIDAPPERAAVVSAALEQGLADFGFDAQPAGERLATFHRVENTYISVFQMLGGLGLALGTLGLGAVLLRNVFERRKELALLRAVGYTPEHLARALVAENGMLLVLGLGAGAISAAIAVSPALAGRGMPTVAPLLILLGVVLVAGAAALAVAVTAIVKSNLLAALRAE